MSTEKPNAQTEGMFVPGKNFKWPYDLAIERVVLGTLIARPEFYDEVAPIVAERDFFDPKHQAIFKTISQLAEKGTAEWDYAVIAALVKEVPSSGFLAEDEVVKYINSLYWDFPNEMLAPEYAKIVHAYWVKREIIRRSLDLASHAAGLSEEPVEKFTAEAQTKIQGLLDGQMQDGRLEKGFTADEIADAELPEIDHVIPGVVSGTVGILTAAGGSGKSMLALQLALCVASGGQVSALDPDWRCARAGDVHYLALEDPDPIVRLRLKTILTEYRDDISADGGLDTLKRVHVHSWYAAGVSLMDSDGQPVAGSVERIARYCAGARLIIVDTLRRIHQGDENSNGEMAQVLSQSEQLAQKTGAAVLILHHESKFAAVSGKAAGQGAARGASAIIDNARYALRMRKPSETEVEDENIRNKTVYLEQVKSNYSAPKPEIKLMRGKGGVLYTDEEYARRMAAAEFGVGE